LNLLIEGNALLGRVIFAHGAGAAMDSEFMEYVSRRLVENQIQVVRFEFDYMYQRRLGGKKRPPDRLDRLIQAYKNVIDSFSDRVPLFLAGKSMGGRVASMLLDQSDAQGCFVFGYPFHPVGKALTTRTNHLRALEKTLYIFQGERDPMGNRTEVNDYVLPSTVEISWLEDGNHDLKPRKISGFTQSDHIDSALNIMTAVICQHYSDSDVNALES
jgi:predicted alpha/beta-hydrolase family hydrolase